MNLGTYLINLNIEYNIVCYNNNKLENYEDIIKLLDAKIDENLKPLYDLTNINGYTILHLLLEKNVQINLKKYIENTNINVQNYQGNTVWHLFNKRWLNYIPELELKKNNVFIKNKKNEIAFNKYKDSDKFMDMLIKSYYNYLKIQRK